MSKNASVKKPKRRLKRSVRRSLAAVLMITAIGVAAVPVPENFAEGEDEPDAPVVALYSYPEDLPSTALSVTLTRPSNEDNIHKIYNIFTTDENESEGSTYRIEWQYEYYTTTVANQPKDIICGYNSTYAKDLLEVSTNPIADYDRISASAFSTFQNTERGYIGSDASNPVSTKAKTYYLPADPENDATLTASEKADLLTYFPEEYQQRVNAYKAYKDYMDLYKAEYSALEKDDNYLSYTPEQLKAQAEANVKTKTGLDPVAEPQASWLSCLDFSEDWQWYRYYCDRNSLSGCQLEKVADPEARGNSPTMVYTYIPRALDASKYNTDGFDSMGFHYISTADVVGIGNDVFKNVQNVKSVVLPRDLKYIGDSAFENSYISSITMENVSEIGNQSFKNCPLLSEVILESGVSKIGTEAFYGISPLRSMTFPATLQYIGPGAFANCKSMTTLDFSADDTTGVVIDDYAFYNNIALSTVNLIRASGNGASVDIVSIGEAAFAVDDVVTGSLTEFTFPTAISRNKNTSSGEGSVGLGDFIFAGRTNLKTVTMPSSYGSSTSITIPNHIFYNCVGLESVVFPDTGTSCGLVSYNEDLFATVTNPDFYVQGPAYAGVSDRTPAYPRQSTWDAYTAVSKIVPYVYYLNGKKYIEVSDGEYLESIDENGVLISCSLKGTITKSPGSVDLVIPAQVAGTTVTGIASDCFANDANEPDNRKMSVVVRTLTLQDDSKIATIDNSVFAGWSNLERVYLGNSVRNIGNNAFQNCISLIDVYFNTPESAAADFKIGTNAFQTNSSELTFHGLIDTAYQPFVWAMDPGNTIDDTGRGIRVCYKSLSPTSLTVMRDNGTGQVTLLDYPKYDQIEDILGRSYAVKNGVYMSSSFNAASYYKEYMESLYESLYASTQYESKRTQFAQAFISASDVNELYKNYDLYGPWISRDFCKNFDPKLYTADAGESIFDWLFEPITAYAASGKPTAYFDTYPYNVYDNYTNMDEIFGPYQTYTEEEWSLLNATKNITVPDGVTSIDVNGFMKSGANNGNVANYLSRDKIGTDTYGMYYTTDSSATEIDRIRDVQGGLFSGTYDDKLNGEGNGGEEGDEDYAILTKGNDRLESIDLNQVTYLPDYAFDSCENLRSVTIGSACTDINKLPFRGCTALTSLTIAEDNPKYVAENRILYSKNDSDSYTIEECLETRGKNSDNSLVSSALDTIIPQVTEIASEAFEACNYISTINLTDATKLTVIPENCFRDCESLIEVDLPIAVNKIDQGAFVGDNLTRLRIPGREVFISTNAFAKDSGKQQPTYVITYEDSSARRYVDTYGDRSQYYLVWEDIGELWDVKFYDMDGTLISEVQVNDGEYLKRDQIPETPVHDGYSFNSWVGTNGVDIYNDAITQNTDVIAKFNSLNGTVDGNYIVNFYDGVTGEQLGPTQLIPEGEAAVEPAYKFHEGYTFLKFSEESTEVTKNMSIIALYTVSGAGGNGVNTSGSTTNTNGANNNTSNRSTGTTTTDGSSTSSTSSSTSTTHRVTVVGGSGSGSYSEGATVVIVADDWEHFKEWRTDSEGVELVMMRASATTFVMPANDVLIVAEVDETAASPVSTLTPAGTGTVSTNTATPTGTSDSGGTRVDITKPGISNKDLATANVNGSTDNFIVKISETPEATQAVIDALTNKYGNLDDILYYAMDISLYDSTGITKITDTTGLTVDITIPLPDALVTYGGNNMMGAVVSDQLEDMSERFTTINGVPCISFTATHFSPYTIYVNTQNLSEGLLDVTPKTGDPIHPKWFLSLGLACLSIILFMKKDKKTTFKKA